MENRTIFVTAEDASKRIDLFLNEELDLSRSYVKTLIEKQNVLVNDSVCKKAGYIIKDKDIINISIPEAEILNLEPENIPIDIVYEDDDLAVINKPQGLVVHPAPGSLNHTLVNALMYHLKNLSDINGVIRPGIVHRLDKDTSGLLVIAKNNEAHLNLQEQIATKAAKRYYVALVDGVVKQDEGVINTLIDRSKKDRKMMAVSNDSGRIAITHYKVLERFPKYTFMEYELKTGRTHQIRVHSKFINHPIVGDSVYGGSNKFDVNGQLLHAYKLCLTHPRTKEPMEFLAPIPKYFEDVLGKLRGN